MGIRTYITRLVRLVMTGKNGDETTGERDTPASNSDTEQGRGEEPDRNADAKEPDSAAADEAEPAPSASDSGGADGAEPNETVSTAAPRDVDGKAGTGTDDEADSDGVSETGEGTDRAEADGDGMDGGGSTEGDEGDAADRRGDGSDPDMPETAVSETNDLGQGGNATEADTAGGAEDTDESKTADDGRAANEEDEEWQLGAILTGERLETWATAAADDVVGDRHEDINPSQHDPDRLERKVRRIEPNSMDDVERMTSLSQEVFRRRKAYIAELEERLAALDERLEEVEADYEQEVSQLNSLMDRKEDRIEELRTFGHESLVGPIVSEVRSDLVGAVSHDDPEAVREAAKYALNDLNDVLRAQGVSLIDPKEGESFDRDRHRPVTRVEDHRPEGTVVDIQQPGFTIEGEVREKANVVISDGTGIPPAEASDPDDETTAEPDDATKEIDEGDGSGEDVGSDGSVESVDEAASDVDATAGDEASGGAEPEDRGGGSESTLGESEGERVADGREGSRSDTKAEANGGGKGDGDGGTGAEREGG